MAHATGHCVAHATGHCVAHATGHCVAHAAGSLRGARHRSLRGARGVARAARLLPRRPAWLAFGFGQRSPTSRGAIRPMSTEFRIEKDSMGDVQVPLAAEWHAPTQRAVENFPDLRAGGDERQLVGPGHRRGCGRPGCGPAEACSTRPRPSAIAAAAAEDKCRGDLDSREFPMSMLQDRARCAWLEHEQATRCLPSLAAEGRLGSSVHPNDDVNDAVIVNDPVPLGHPRAAHQRGRSTSTWFPALPKHLASSLTAKGHRIRDDRRRVRGTPT